MPPVDPKKLLKLALLASFCCFFYEERFMVPLFLVEPLLVFELFTGEQEAFPSPFIFFSSFLVVGHISLVVALFRKEEITIYRFGFLGLILVASFLVYIWFSSTDHGIVIGILSKVPFGVLTAIFFKQLIMLLKGRN